MIAIRPGRRASWREPADRRSDMLRGAALAVALVGMVASALVAQGWRRTVTSQRDERLERTATSRTVTVSSALANYENALQAARSLWLASNSVNRPEFNAFARSLDLPKRYPGLQGIGWRTVVTDDQVAAFVARNRAGGEPGFTIRPPGRRPLYYVTQLSYPRIPSSSDLGADARAIPTILATLERARDTGRTTISNQTTLPGDLDLPAPQRPVAFELFVPVYRRELGHNASVAERRRQFVGWAAGQFRAGDFLHAALQSTTATTGVELHDETAGHGSLIASEPTGFRARGPDVRETPFTFGERTFVLRYAPLPGNPILTERTIPASLLLGAGIGVSLLLGALLCLALVDLDHFKAYNDRHGHPAGDRLLRAAAAAWQERLRKTDLLARYGGEEFAVLLPNCGVGDAMEIAERLRTALPEGTCSIGVASWDRREEANALVDRADRALYAAKKGGRNRSCADLAEAAEAAGRAQG